MIFRSHLRDCLYLNWALPAEALPPLEPPLRPDVVAWRGRGWVFGSGALMRVKGLHLQSVPLLKLSHPQFVLRQCILDGDGLPAFYLRTVLMPGWAAPLARLVGRQPARRGSFTYPPEGAGGRGFWEVRRRRRLAFQAEVGSPCRGHGPDLGSWEQTVAYFARRRCSYFRRRGALRKVELSPRLGEAVPLDVELADGALLPRCLALTGSEPWPELHSAWICPEESFLFELGRIPEGSLPRELPAPG